jgi:hypothetical protein
MACIKIKNRYTNEESWHPEGVAYPQAWFTTGEINWGCGPQPVINLENSSIDEELGKEGLQIGDAIAWVTGKMGITQCSSCHARQEILNNAKALGWKETIRQIKATFKKAD